MDSVRRKLCFAALWALLAALIVSLPVSSQAQQYQAVFLSSTDEVLAQAQAISGLRAAGFGQGEITDYQPHALAWEAGQMIDIHPKDGDYWYSYALDASLLGVAGYGLNGTDFADHAMLWKGANYTLTDLHPDGYLSSYANGIWGLSVAGSAFLYDWETLDYISHAYYWPAPWPTGIDLHPAGYLHSSAEGIWGLQIVGSATTSDYTSHAFLWKGLNRTPVDIHPAGFEASTAVKVFDGRIVGWGKPEDDEIHAIVWQGPGHTAADIHPSGFTSSQATDVSLSNVVGFAATPPTPEGFTFNHAIVWQGPSFTPVDLHQYLPESYLSSAAYGTDLLGNIVGQADGRAVLWVRVGN